MNSNNKYKIVFIQNGNRNLTFHRFDKDTLSIYIQNMLDMGFGLEIEILE